MDRRVWLASVHGVSKDSDTTEQLSMYQVPEPPYLCLKTKPTGGQLCAEVLNSFSLSQRRMGWVLGWWSPVSVGTPVGPLEKGKLGEC